MSELMEALSPLGYQALPTAEQVDCGIDVVAFWDGKERAAATWKGLRLELASALEAGAEEPTWHGILEACGEGSGAAAYARRPSTDATCDDAGPREPMLSESTAETESTKECALVHAAASFYFPPGRNGNRKHCREPDPPGGSLHRGRASIRRRKYRANATALHMALGN